MNIEQRQDKNVSPSSPFVTIYLKKKIMYFYSKLLHKQGQTVHMLQFFGIYIPLARCKI